MGQVNSKDNLLQLKRELKIYKIISKMAEKKYISQIRAMLDEDIKTYENRKLIEEEILALALIAANKKEEL